MGDYLACESANSISTIKPTTLLMDGATIASYGPLPIWKYQKTTVAAVFFLLPIETPAEAHFFAEKKTSHHCSSCSSELSTKDDGWCCHSNKGGTCVSHSTLE